MSRQLFGTDGIRGPAGTYPLDDAGMTQIGKAVGTYFARQGGLVLVGWDPRESSEGLAESLIQGLVSVSVKVNKMGIVPTPGLAYLTKNLKAEAGVIITASHNLYTDNGVKVFTPDGRKLSDKHQDGLNNLIGTDIPGRGTGSVTEHPEAVRAYEAFLASCAGGISFDGLKIGVDSANGATSGIAGRVFKALGAEVSAMHDKPDGRNINVRCGATDPSALQDAVRERGLDAGIALDGDGDRVVMVDGKGRLMTGDHIMYILAVDGKQKGVVATIMSNHGLEEALSKQGITLRRSAVGDRSVLAGMDETGFTLGGEQSGHIIIYDHSSTGDGMLSAIRAIAASVSSGRSLAEWCDELELLPQALVSIPFPDKDLLESPGVQAIIASETNKLAGKGRLNVRASGTEPKVRVMVEAPDAQHLAQGIADRLAETITENRGKS